MTRALSSEEHALWQRVTADVRPSVAVGPTERILAPVSAAAPLRVATAHTQHRVQQRRSDAPLVEKPKTVRSNTLDATWDRNLRNGLVEPDRVVDLHGCTLAAAHSRAMSAIAAAYRAGDRIVVLITGRPPAPGKSRMDAPLRGVIRASIGDWIAASEVAGSIAAVRVAHRRHGGDGAIYVILRRKNRTTG